MSYFTEKENDFVKFSVCHIPDELLNLVNNDIGMLIPKLITNIPIISWSKSRSNDEDEFIFIVSEIDVVHTHKLLMDHGFRSSAFLSKWENVKDMYAATYNENYDSSDDNFDSSDDFDSVLVPSIVWNWDWLTEPQE